MIEIKMRNAERAKEDAEKRNDMLQKEMEQFSRLGSWQWNPGEPREETRYGSSERHSLPLSQAALGRTLGDSGGKIIWDQVAGHLAVQSSSWERHIIYRHYLPISSMCTKVVSCPIMLLLSVKTGYVYI